MSRPRFADEIRHTPASPPEDATDGRWVVEQAAFHAGPSTDPDELVTWSLVLRHADDGHLERVDTDARKTTTYRPGQEVDGRIVLTLTGRRFRRAKPRVGSREA